jgi:hypothetical protein
VLRQCVHLQGCCMNSLDAKTQPAKIGMGSPQSVAAALPYLLGFHPEESLICLWLHDGELLVLQRADLSAQEQELGYVDAFLDAASNIRANEVVIVCVTRDVRKGKRVARGVVARARSHVRSALILSGGRVRSIEPGGHWQWVSAHDRQDASRTFGQCADGRRIRRTRHEVATEVRYDQAMDWEQADDAAVDADHLSELLARADFAGHRVRRQLRDGAMGVPGRDLIMWWGSRVPTHKRRELLEALLVGLRATPPGQGAHLACAAAATAWLCGDGVRANAALERCLDEDPVNAMGRMLESAMGAAVPPATFAQMLGDVGPEVVGANQAVVDSLERCGYSPR